MNSAFKLAHLVIQLITGNSNISGNELADSAVKALDSGGGSLIRAPAVQSRQAQEAPPIQHPRIREVYVTYSRERKGQVRTRSDQSLFAKLRSGHFTSLWAYKARIDNVPDLTCKICGQEPQTNEPWLQECTATTQQRWDMFGAESGSLDCFTRIPLETISLVMRTLIGKQS